MKVLWLSSNPSLYTERKKEHKGYNGVGWVGALEKRIEDEKDMELGVAFLSNDDSFKVVTSKTIYYPINLYNTITKKLRHNLFYEKYDEIEIKRIKNIVEDFKPDIIHVWGTEISFGLITKHTKIPVVIHLQGILNPYFNTFLIPGISKKIFLNKSNSGIFRRLFNSQTWRFWEHNIKREIEIFQNCRYFMGRTNWDKSITSVISPKSKYFYCSELLRIPFYNANVRQSQNRKKLYIISVLSNPTYKGIDLVLKCANILKQHTKIDFEWNIFGVSDCHFVEKLTQIKAEDVHVNIRGISSPEMLIKELQNSDLFVHPSYIDNSPNSVCEAQMLGLPILATNVGGVSSLIEDYKTGILIPANDPWFLVSKIIEIESDIELRNTLGINARQEAINRHDSVVIKNTLISIYHEIIMESKK